jgi:hypothetical protein
VERHLVPAVRNAAGPRPAFRLEHLEHALVLAQAVRERAVELQPVAIGTQSAVAEEVARVLMAEEVLPRRHRPRILRGQRRLQGVVEGIARLLEPEERVLPQHARIGDRGRKVEAAVRVHGQARGAVDLGQDGFDAPLVLRERRAPDLHLHHGVAAIDVAPHLRAQGVDPLVRRVVAAGGVHEDARIGGAPVALGEEPEERPARDLGYRVPDGHVDGPHRDRALAVPARLLVPHQDAPDAVGIEVLAGRVAQALRIRLEQARREALADEPALAVAAVRVEPVADDAPAVADHVRDHGDEARRHPAEVDVRVPDPRPDGARRLPHLEDAHAPFSRGRCTMHA